MSSSVEKVIEPVKLAEPNDNSNTELFHPEIQSLQTLLTEKIRHLESEVRNLKNDADSIKYMYTDVNIPSKIKSKIESSLKESRKVIFNEIQVKKNRINKLAALQRKLRSM